MNIGKEENALRIWDSNEKTFLIYIIKKQKCAVRKSGFITHSEWAWYFFWEFENHIFEGIKQSFYCYGNGKSVKVRQMAQGLNLYKRLKIEKDNLVGQAQVTITFPDWSRVFGIFQKAFNS